VTLVVDGRSVRAARGTSLLLAARRAGIEIPTLCHHEALEPWGGCRLCVVDVTYAGKPGGPGMVISCQFPVEDGLVVETDSERVRATRREILDLLLARCPDTPLIQRLAREYGLLRTSYRRNPEPTDCILCGLCVRVCDHLGIAAISTVSRGIGREVAPPFRQPPPDCVGCLACAEICPTGHIRFDSSDAGRAIWGKSFAMQRCPTCGRAHITVAQADLWAARTGMERASFDSCDACKRAALARTIACLQAAG
jgi:bidirectional [NiFe] hydrogenase diaphorase subunit